MELVSWCKYVQVLVVFFRSWHDIISIIISLQQLWAANNGFSGITRTIIDFPCVGWWPCDGLRVRATDIGRSSSFWPHDALPGLSALWVGCHYMDYILPSIMLSLVIYLILRTWLILYGALMSMGHQWETDHYASNKLQPSCLEYFLQVTASLAANHSVSRSTRRGNFGMQDYWTRYACSRL